MRIETRAVRARACHTTTTGDVAPPIHLSTTFERDPDGQPRRGFVYARSESPNREALEAALADLDGGAAAVAFPSGAAAISAVLAALPKGAAVVLPRDLYHGARTLVHELGPRLDLMPRTVSVGDLLAGTVSLPSQPGLLWIETPSNPNLEITDIRAAVAVARRAGWWVAVDGTWATPVLQRPLELGADLVVHSTTKYLGGHSDVLGGAVVLGASAAAFEPQIRAWQQVAGAVPSAFDCWLVLRGLTTLPLRVRAHSAHARALAEALVGHPRLVRVAYPGLPDDPGHAVAASQMQDGFGGMLAIEVDGGREAAFRLLQRLRLFTRATSLGGVESLAEHRASVEGEHTRAPEGLIRLSIGLEHPDDLIEDLMAGLAGL